MMVIYWCFVWEGEPCAPDLQQKSQEWLQPGYCCLILVLVGQRQNSARSTWVYQKEIGSSPYVYFINIGFLAGRIRIGDQYPILYGW